MRVGGDCSLHRVQLLCISERPIAGFREVPRGTEDIGREVHRSRPGRGRLQREGVHVGVERRRQERDRAGRPDSGTGHGRHEPGNEPTFHRGARSSTITSPSDPLRWRAIGGWSPTGSAEATTYQSPSW
jgi:hypothetical protein